MRLFKYLVPCLVIVLLLSWSGISTTEAAGRWPKKSGWMCWEYTNSEGTQTLKFRVSNIGGGQYLLSGKSGSGDSIGHGSAVIKGDSVQMIITYSGKDNESMWIGTGFAVLDKATLNGTWEAIDTDRDYSGGKITTQYIPGTFISVSCPR